MPENKFAISIRDASKSYDGHEALAVHDVSLDVREGEFVAIVGFSGSGKSTLVSLMAGLLEPDCGSIMLRGKPVTGPGPDRGVVF